MPLPLLNYQFVTTTTPLTISDNAEHILLTSPVIFLPDGATQVVIAVWVSGVNSAAVGNFTVRIRRGTTLAGAQVGALMGESPPQNANFRFGVSGCQSDQVQLVGNQQYVLTGAGSNNLNFASEFATMLVLVS